MEKLTFSHKCYKLLKERVPRGKVTTYKALAESLGTKAYRAVGTAMNKNPYAFKLRSGLERAEKYSLSSTPIVPCHRVISNDGTLGGFATGLSNKIKLLKSEGVEIKNNIIPEKFILREL